MTPLKLRGVFLFTQIGCGWQYILMICQFDLDNIADRMNVPGQVIFVSGLRIFATWRLLLERIHC
jgi:hypothetical protein